MTIFLKKYVKLAFFRPKLENNSQNTDVHISNFKFSESTSRLLLTKGNRIKKYWFFAKLWIFKVEKSLKMTFFAYKRSNIVATYSKRYNHESRSDFWVSKTNRIKIHWVFAKLFKFFISGHFDFFCNLFKFFGLSLNEAGRSTKSTGRP